MQIDVDRVIWLINQLVLYIVILFIQEAVTEFDTLPEPVLTLQVVRHFSYSLSNVFNT